MREKKNHLYVDSQERSILLHSLVELKNQLIQQGRYTDCVDELIFKVVNAPVKRMKIECKRLICPRIAPLTNPCHNRSV